MEGTKVSLLNGLDSFLDPLRIRILSDEGQIRGTAQRDFRYSMIAHRSSGDNAGPITPLPRGPSLNSWPGLLLPARDVSYR